MVTGWQKQIGRDGISLDIYRLINRANVYRFQVDGAETEKSCEENLTCNAVWSGQKIVLRIRMEIVGS